jgi:hypothetical protein
MLDVDQEDEGGDKARDTKLPQMLKVFVDFFFMIIQKISSGMLYMFLQLHKHLMQCILPHVCPDVSYNVFCQIELISYISYSFCMKSLMF